ncbi:serine/threonine-protein kinase haspin [Ochotona princeps]|uniref:serine/threonine-protein kinase haspin n=1 Tax=Ochotona princeps TaxID=9978 RepID=UPI002714B715|nr:serine/threonine-protein kinase haspin [Ochotona princeps]
MSASLAPPGSRLFRTYGVARGPGPGRRGQQQQQQQQQQQPGRAAAAWFPPEDWKRFFSSSSSSEVSLSTGLSSSVASDDPADPDYPGSPVGRRRRRRPGGRASQVRGTLPAAATPRRLRLRARLPQKCSTPCDQLRLPAFPGRRPGLPSPDVSMDSQDADELGTSASLFGDAAVVSSSPEEAAPGGRLSRMVLRARASLRSALLSLTDSGRPAADSEREVSGDHGTASCAKTQPVGSRLQGPGLPGTGQKRGAGRGSCRKAGSQRAAPSDSEDPSGSQDSVVPKRILPKRKRKHEEAVETSLQHSHGPKKGQQVGGQSALAHRPTRLRNTCSWTKIRASLGLHKKKIVADASDVCSTYTITSSLSESLLSDHSGPSVPHRTRSAASPWHSSSIYLLSPLISLPVADKKSHDAEKVYWECNQEGPIPFSYCLPTGKLERCEKIGEGVFGEVFQIFGDHNTPVALKIVAIEGPDLVNGAHQKTFEEILPEIIISKELSLLSTEACNRTEGFIGLNSVHCVQGPYPALLLRAWDRYHSTKGSANDRPDFFEEDQLFIVLEFEFGGTDLEQMKTKLSSMATAKSILHQVTASLAVAEESLHFEHRDLHWGNVLLKKTNVRELQYTLKGETRAIPTCGLQVNIIDYTLSRLERDGIVVFCDISTDEELFSGQGDYQFDIYRLMRKENNNCWGEYHPYNNVLWLHYLTDKILKQVTFKRNCNTPSMKKLKKKIEHFHKTVLDFSSATDLLCEHSLFQ